MPTNTTKAVLSEYDWRIKLERAGYRVLTDPWSYTTAPAGKIPEKK